LYYSSYLPLHGVEHIVAAAGLLKQRRNMQFRLIGRGMTFNHVRNLADRLGVTNTRFLAPVSYAQLPREIAAADLCLGGPFGNTPKARRIIPGKTFQFLAMARPVIATDTPGNRELLFHEHSAYLVPLADPEALAAAIEVLHADVGLRERIAAEGYECYHQRCSEAAIRQRLFEIVDEGV
jgi:glycosyltransferase involved in cell wall biosynthesis